MYPGSVYHIGSNMTRYICMLRHIYLSIYLSIDLSIYLSIYLSTYVYIPSKTQSYVQRLINFWQDDKL